MPRIKYNARFPGPIQGHAVNTIRRFYPKLAAEYDFDDLMQEAWLVFDRCKRRYGQTVDNAAWFMALYSRSLQNRLINLSAKTGRYISIEAMEALPEPATELDEGFAYRLLHEMPDEVKKLIVDVCEGTIADGRLAFAQMKQKYNLT